MIGDYTKTMVGTDDELPNDIDLKNVVLLITSVIKDGGNFCPQIFLNVVNKW